MAQINIAVTVGQNGKLTDCQPRRAKAHPGDVIAWTFDGDRRNHLIGIGGFRDKETGNAKNPMTEASYSIAPADPDTKNGNVENTDEAKGLYRYRIVSIAVPKMKALASEMSAQSASPVRPEFVLRVMTGCDGDSELDPEVQIGG
jgi:plastocyanin